MPLFLEKGANVVLQIEYYQMFLERSYYNTALCVTSLGSSDKMYFRA